MYSLSCVCIRHFFFKYIFLAFIHLVVSAAEEMAGNRMREYNLIIILFSLIMTYTITLIPVLPCCLPYSLLSQLRCHGIIPFSRKTTRCYFLIFLIDNVCILSPSRQDIKHLWQCIRVLLLTQPCARFSFEWFRRPHFDKFDMSCLSCSKDVLMSFSKLTD